MQMVLHLSKHEPPSRTALLEASAKAVLRVCLDDRAAEEGEYAAALQRWYDHRIRKVTRRARNAGWRNVQGIEGATVEHPAQVRAFLPGAVHAVPPLLRKLQISGTDLPTDAPGPPSSETPLIMVNRGLGMTLGKTAAQVGHAAMLLAGSMPTDWVREWEARDFAVSVREVDPAVWAEAVVLEDSIPVVDAGFTEVAPNTTTVVACASANMLPQRWWEERPSRLSEQGSIGRRR